MTPGGNSQVICYEILCTQPHLGRLWLTVKQPELEVTLGAVALNAENGHPDLASGNLHIFKCFSSYLLLPGSGLEQAIIPNLQIFTVHL